MLLGLGLVWPRLKLGAKASWVAFWTYLYSSFATLVPYMLAAAWGAGNSTIPLAAGTAQGSAFSGGYYPGCAVFGCANIFHFDGAYSLGPASRECSAAEQLAEWLYPTHFLS